MSNVKEMGCLAGLRGSFLHLPPATLASANPSPIPSHLRSSSHCSPPECPFLWHSSPCWSQRALPKPSLAGCYAHGELPPQHLGRACSQQHGVRKSESLGGGFLCTWLGHSQGL